MVTPTRPAPARDTRVYDRMLAQKSDDVVTFKRERGGLWWFIDGYDKWAPADFKDQGDELMEAMIAAGKLYEVPLPKKAPKAKPGSDRPSTGDAW